MILSGELEVIAAVPGEGDEEDGYDGEGGKDGGYGGAYIEEEGRYSTVPTRHPKMQMHLEEINDQRVAAVVKNSIPILYMIHLFAFTLPLAHNIRLARPRFLFPVGTTHPPLPFPNWPRRKFDALLLRACAFLLLSCSPSTSIRSLLLSDALSLLFPMLVSLISLSSHSIPVTPSPLFRDLFICCLKLFMSGMMTSWSF